MNKKLINTLIDKIENLRQLFESESELLDKWDDEICSLLDALDDVEGDDTWECLSETHIK